MLNDNKHHQSLYRPLKIAKSYDVCIGSTRVFKGALYGRIKPNLYIMVTDFKQFRKKDFIYDIYVMDLRKKGGWREYILRANNWMYNPIMEYITKYILYTPAENAVDMLTTQRKIINACGPQERKIPQPQSRCFKQCQVDGRGYNISWEENYYEPTNYPVRNNRYTGNPVEYEKGHTLPKAAFTPFEGFTDSDYARRRDGLKIDPTKCKPQKIKNTTIVIRVNGVVKDN